MTDQVEGGIKNLPIAGADMRRAGKNYLETDGGFHERENQPTEAAYSDTGHECEGNPSPTDLISRHHVRVPNADTPRTAGANRAGPSALPQR